METAQGSGTLAGHRLSPMTPLAELINGRLAMLGFVVAIGTYATTGPIIRGLF